MRMISAWSKSKSVLVVPKTRKKQEHHCDAKQQLPSVNKSGDANIESIESQPLSSSITSTATIVAPDCIDAFARKSKRCLHLPTILTCVLGSFGKKRVKLKQSDWSSPSCKKCKKPTRASPRKDLPASPVVSETTHTGATATSVSSIVFNTDTQSETVSKYVVVDDVTPTKLDNNEANDVECTNKQNSIEIQSETFSVQSLSTNVGPDISEESILLADSSMSDLRDAMLFEENPKLPDSEHAMIQNDSNSQIVQVQIQQSSSSAQTENYVSILRSPKIVDDSSGSRKSQLNGPKLFVPGESKLDVRKTKKFAGSVDINELGIDKLFPACYQLENVITENKHDKIFGAVSAIVKPMDLDKDDFKQLLMGVAKRTGVTPVFSSNADTLIHGSWQALNRAYQLLQDVGKLILQEESLVEPGENKQCVYNSQDKESLVEPAGENKQCAYIIQDKDLNLDTGKMQKNRQDTDVDSSINPNMMSTDPSVPMYGCSMCDKLFTNADKLRVHAKSHKPESEWKCQICGKSFNAKRYLHVHMQRHSSERKHKCPMCEWSFFEKRKLKLHMEVHKTADEKNLPFKCEKCDRKFYNRAARSDHMNIHTGERPYKCHICQSTFSHRVGLNRHMLVHSDEKHFKCSNCEKSFKFKDKLMAHMVQHTGVGGHRCSACQKVFTALSSLRRHKCTAIKYMVRDTQETIFMCGVCGEMANSLENAQLHITSHSGHESVEDVTQEFVNIENEGSYINNINILEGIQNFSVAEVLHLESTGTMEIQ